MERLTLPDAPWRHRPELDRLAEVLGAAAGEARFVGGAVRDTLLGIDVADIDIATRHAPQEVIARLEAAGIRTVPTGLAHGTVTAVSAGTVVEVTTLRRDVATDGRHALVAFTDDWQEDAARRDFTINALYADPSSGAVIDFFGGLDDLAAGRVRFIGDPYRRIAEDHLRILRFFRFHARFGDAIDAAGLAACTARANDLMALSRERIAAELLKLLVARRAVAVVALMVERGILAPVLPEIDAAGVARLDRLAGREALAGIVPHPIRRLAALLAPGSAEAVGARLKLSSADRRRLGGAVASGPAPGPVEERPAAQGVGRPLPGSGATDGDDHPRILAYRLGTAPAVDRLLLGDGDPGRIAALARWTPPVLPLTGGALVARGVGKGPEVARLLRRVEERWIAEGFPDAARVEALADEAVDQWRREASSAQA